MQKFVVNLYHRWTRGYFAILGEWSYLPMLLCFAFLWPTTAVLAATNPRLIDHLGYGDPWGLAHPVISALDGSFQQLFFFNKAYMDLAVYQILLVLMSMAFINFIKKALDEFRLSTFETTVYLRSLLSNV